jgi:hypothetical protein
MNDKGASQPPNGSQLPYHRSIVALDIENSTGRTNMEKAHLRQVMYTLLEGALHSGGIAEDRRDPLVDRGDGVLALIPSEGRDANMVVLNPVIPTLNMMLIEHNNESPEHRLRLRVVLHAGLVHRDRQGWFGAALDIAFRLLDARRLKEILRKEIQAFMAFVVSDDIYRTIIEQDYPGIDKSAFADQVRVKVAKRTHVGRVMIPQPRMPEIPTSR